jgi:hypothetical protein
MLKRWAVRFEAVESEPRFMGIDASLQLRRVLEQQILARTGRRIANLSVEVRGGQVVLGGQAGSFHVKQLAQHGVREVLPTAPLRNAIVVQKLVG